jgi:ABC-type antimicrobial peptide transport system permease subunit
LPRDWTEKGIKKMAGIRDRLSLMPQVSSVSLSFEIPDGSNSDKIQISKMGGGAQGTVAAERLITDYQYAAVYGIALKAGTFFNPLNHAADSDHVVINETASEALGWKDPQSAVGQNVIYDSTSYTISGVVADFHLGSMHDKIEPLIFNSVHYSNIYRYFSFRIKPGNMQQSILALQRKWADVLPNAPFAYHFMDEALNDLYSNEIQLKKAAFLATIIAIVIVSLGVLGLISLSIQKRTKEIGIRKIIGSSAGGITGLFLKDFLSVVLLAGLIACPLAWLVMQKWLDDYTYQISITVTPFIISISLLTGITAILIVLQTMKAAFAKPVNSLRNE